MIRELARAARTDELTGLSNLLHTTHRLDALLADGRELLVAAVAVDSFREVNDTLGHQTGDRLLLEVADRLRAAAPDALLGRIGGSRFAVAIEADRIGGDAALFGLALQSHVEGSTRLGAFSTHVRLSVGCSHGPDHGEDGATLLRRAETAMYSARHSQGGPVLWEAAYEVQAQRRLAVVMALREALAGEAIGVAFQPKVSVATRQVCGVEALARWNHVALGEILPDEFVPLAEAAGLLAPLTSTVMQQAVAACQMWQEAAPGVGVSVNISAGALEDSAFVGEVAGALRSSDLDPGLLTLELTEDVVVADPQLARERMTELRRVGVRLSVDDFGTGYSSLTYLKLLPIDEVKIDKGFVSALARDPADQAVVQAVVDIAHALQLTVVAEGVENEEQQAVLMRLGVDELQGYLHGSPMVAAEATAWLRKQCSGRAAASPRSATAPRAFGGLR